MLSKYQKASFAGSISISSAGLTFVPDTHQIEKQLVMSDDGDYDVDGGDFDGDDIDNDIDEAGDEAEQGENVDILPGPEQRNPENRT